MDYDLALLAVIEDVSRLFVAQGSRVARAHARIAAPRFALRPAGDFHAGKAHFACRIDHFLKRPAIQNGADKAQFHCVVPPSKCRRICRPFLYAGFIIACSRAKENREKRKCLIFNRIRLLCAQKRNESGNENERNLCIIVKINAFELTLKMGRVKIGATESGKHENVPLFRRLFY